MTKIKNCLFLVIALFAANHLHAQTLHVIGFGATDDEKIGNNCAIDMNYFYGMTEIIASMIGYEPNFYDWGVGRDCNKEFLKKTLSSLNCGENDIVIFYYTGHGTREFGDTNRFPRMQMNGKTKDEFVPVQTVIDQLARSKARFKLVLTDCCNMPLSLQPPAALSIGNPDVWVTTNETVEANYRKLFVEAKGLVAVTSSSAGEYSLTSKDKDGEAGGSIFSIAFYNALTDIVYGADKENVTWKNLLKHVNDKMKYMVVPTQTAAYLIMLDDYGRQMGVTTSPIPVLTANKDFAQDMAELVNRTLPLNYRIGKVNAIAKKWFAANAEVASMARNGNVVLDYYKDVIAFLRHVAIADEVVRIIVLKEQTTPNGKINYIEVQEVRKQNK